MRDHRKLEAFQLAHQLVLDIYRATASFPKSELFGLTSQMRRAAVSVPANIVEGSARHSEADYIRFLDIGFASLRELGYFLELAGDLAYIRPEDLQELSAKQTLVAMKLGRLIKKLRG